MLVLPTAKSAFLRDQIQLGGLYQISLNVHREDLALYATQLTEVHLSKV